ncbi:hypothetical protein PAMP_016746 [Pampus punctatissimus]
MEENSLDPDVVEQARTFWAQQDVDHVFTSVFVYLDHLKKVLKANKASDKECVEGLKLVECVNWSGCSPAATQVVQVIIGSVKLPPPEFPHCSPSASHRPSSNGLPSPAAPPAGREELLPLSTVQLQSHLHPCCKSCLPSLPRMAQSMPPFWGQNPLKVPLLCGFKRLSATPLMSPGGGGDRDPEGVWSADEEEDVVYKAPCGQSLRNYDDVMRFLLVTDSYDVLQVDYFTFNPTVRLDPPVATGPWRPELDLSRGSELTPVELCAGDGGARPADFRYRRDRWPHGCFLSRGLTLFETCCDCSDGCSDAKRCACIARTKGGGHYTHHRLTEPVATGVYECGPWCGCDRARCQNRLVQRGIRVRLQVFHTDRRGWGVRCRDDLDRGTFVCIYAGVILRWLQTPAELAPPKQQRVDLPSDDEVEVVTEWLAPPVLEGRSNLLETPPPPTSPSLHVPVIQRPAEASSTSAPQDRDKVQTVLVGGPEAASRSAGEKKVSMTMGSPDLAVSNSVKGTKMESPRNLKRAMKVEDVYFLDASKEGNVSRFINL